MITFPLTVATFLLLASLSEEHGFMREPPSRASAWLTDPDFVACCKNYEYNQMFCGGTMHQWELNGGQCGICGDPWDAPKRYERGGDHYLGKVVRKYEMGALVPITIQITANHKGFFEFRLCDVDHWKTDATQECLNQTVLDIFNTNSDNPKRYTVHEDLHVADLQVVLPSNISCHHCVLQWKYVAGNSWGFDPETNRSCVGCGPIQEHFLGCSDIAIGNVDYEEEETTTSTTTLGTSTTTTKTVETYISVEDEPNDHGLDDHYQEQPTEGTIDESSWTENMEAETTTTTTTTNEETSSPALTEITTQQIEIIENNETTPEKESTATTTMAAKPITTTAEGLVEIVAILEALNMKNTSKPVVTTPKPMANDSFGYNGCKSRLEFGTTIDISRMVSIYCYRMCKVRCTELTQSAPSVEELRARHGKEYDACANTCPVLCSCT